MTIVAYVDPGVHASGVAWFRNGTLIAAELRSENHPLTRGVPGLPGWWVEKCVCEKPQVYSAEAQARAFGRRIRAEDIADLLIAAGRMTAALPTEYLTPAQWKGSRDKAKMHARLLDPSKGILTASEREVIEQLRCAPTLRHNVLDAVCMGLVLNGRWK